MTRTVQVRNSVQFGICPKKMIAEMLSFSFNCWFTGTIELKEMTEIIGTLYQMEGVAKVGQIIPDRNHMIILQLDLLILDRNNMIILLLDLLKISHL